ncbi:hypothetical protein [Kitasatospora purpeofusca]|uniref:hypothetical protein n=1 Tax=Kitasatospora purpeofusca TaxID=67352 RepID=UPI0022572808|nr:hypothetical protein [Kitasatospora purpeofusca]MCX4753931.1 hypothetical protein [Kitasatospora purpeofusca]WSR33395.1 hypothetical protein OG715_21815 [Kitasatospora purpeofusca]WSR41477.1 hypothetical protein OG196_21610 [Kitasatospora purpeofusca]
MSAPMVRRGPRGFVGRSAAARRMRAAAVRHSVRAHARREDRRFDRICAEGADGEVPEVEDGFAGALSDFVQNEVRVHLGPHLDEIRDVLRQVRMTRSA